MSLQIADEMIKEIAEQLDCGMKCFYHIKTGALETYPDNSNEFYGSDDNPLQDVMDKIDEHYNEYIRFEGMESYESFIQMENFINEITDKETQHRFEEIILRRKPFQQFKNLLRDYSELRTQWFAYKEQRY